MRILVIDDDQSICRSMQLTLEHEGHQVRCAYCAREGIEAFKVEPAEIAFVDLQLPDESGLEVLRVLRDLHPAPLMVMITGYQDTKATIEAVRIGAFDYIRKPLDYDTILVTLEKASQYLARPSGRKVASVVESGDYAHEIVGANPEIIDVIKKIGLLSQSNIPVLIEGESGTGKELVARGLHEATSPSHPFVAINCSAVVPTLLESELFGHEKGAFTGAESTKTGRLESAGEGTIFFDEIGEMAADMQVKLLRALQENEFERVGGLETIPLRARVIAATNRDLKSCVAQGTFREDLYYRLAVSTIRVPPLRERKEDIPLLAEHLIDRISRDLEKEVIGVEEAALIRLKNYDWPGNVRELKNVLLRAVALNRNTIITEDIICESMEDDLPAEEPRLGVSTLRDAEKRHIEAALLFTGWNKKQAAALLDISRVTLRKKIQDYGLLPPLKSGVQTTKN